METGNRRTLSPEYVYAAVLAAPRDFFTGPKPAPQIVEASIYFRQLMRISDDRVKTCADLLKGLRNIENLHEIPLKPFDRLFMPSREKFIKSPEIWDALMKVVELKKEPEGELRKFVPKTLEEEYEAIDKLATAMGENPKLIVIQVVLERMAIKVVLPENETDRNIY